MDVIELEQQYYDGKSNDDPLHLEQIELWDDLKNSSKSIISKLKMIPWDRRAISYLDENCQMKIKEYRPVTLAFRQDGNGAEYKKFDIINYINQNLVEKEELVLEEPKHALSSFDDLISKTLICSWDIGNIDNLISLVLDDLTQNVKIEDLLLIVDQATNKKIKRWETMEIKTKGNKRFIYFIDTKNIVFKLLAPVQVFEAFESDEAALKDEKMCVLLGEIVNFDLRTSASILFNN